MDYMSNQLIVKLFTFVKNEDDKLKDPAPNIPAYAAFNEDGSFKEARSTEKGAIKTLEAYKRFIEAKPVKTSSYTPHPVPYAKNLT